MKKIPLNFSLFLITLFWYSVVMAYPEDSTRILACRNYFNLTSTLIKPIFSSTLVNKDDDQSLQYRTLNPYRFGIALDYRWFGIELSTNIPTFKAQNIRKGKTESNSFRFSINSRKFWVTASLQNYHGFYLNNDGFFYNPISTQNPLPKRPDLNCNVIHLSAFYVFNHKTFSNPAAVGQFERQLKSGGSPFIGLGYLRNELMGDSSFVPGPKQREFPNLNSVRSIASTNIFFSAGYAQTFVLKQTYFFAVYLAPGIGLFRVEETLDNGSRRKSRLDLGLRYETRGVVGYNGVLWYYGCGYFGYWNNEKLFSGNYFSQTFQTFRIFLGKRFRTNKQLGFLGL